MIPVPQVADISHSIQHLTVGFKFSSFPEQLIRSPNIFQMACFSDFNQCTASANLPSNFCCPATSTCNLLLDSTILCCPLGADCSAIRPIICDITAQDATLHPNATIKTTMLNQKLLVCGRGCCPFGYECGADGNCVLVNAANVDAVSTFSTTLSSPIAMPTSRTSTISDVFEIQPTASTS